MWSLKFLSGPKAGKEILLQPGLCVIGREESCQISVPSSSISKRHAQILIKESGVVIEDLDSRNGIFIKGKQIQRQTLKAGDRVALSDVIFELRKKALPQHPLYALPPGGYPQAFPPAPDMTEAKPSIDAKGPLAENMRKVVKTYVDNALLPGIYKLAEWMEFKFIVGAFVAGFVILVTALSSFPLISILRSSVEQESRNSAENIAITLAKDNKRHLRKGLQTAVNVDYALRRPGVEKAYIISAADGRILAPAELAHTYPKNSIIHKARKQDRNTVEKSGASIIAVTPISFYQPKTGESAPRAYSVVIYNMGSLLVGAKRAASLLAQTFLIASLAGLALFFFLVSLIEFPIKSLNSQLARAIKDDKSPSISMSYRSEILTELCGHINSALNQISLGRMMSAKGAEEAEGEIGRQNEMNNLVEVIGFPALSVNLEDETVGSLNSNFSDQIGFSEILHQPLSEISDSQLKDHIFSLIERAKSQPREIAFGELSLNHISMQSACQFVAGKGAPAYAIVAFMPPPAEEGAA